MSWPAAQRPRAGRTRTAKGAIKVCVRQVRGSAKPSRSPLMSFYEGNPKVLGGLVSERYPRGLSTRDVEDAFIDATGELLISKSAVSKVTGQLWRGVERFCACNLRDVTFEYRFCDTIFESLRREGVKEPSSSLGASTHGSRSALASCARSGRAVVPRLGERPRARSAATAAWRARPVAGGRHGQFETETPSAPSAMTRNASNTGPSGIVRAGRDARKDYR